ncbi:MAG TPA: hypothetical protein VGU90_17440 [Terriglobales bacterium]|nr:hypothetical protein [Terriglobales bacterium]
MRRIGISLVASLGIAIFIGIGGEVVMHLWNWNLPAVFGWRQITFWQAIGLFALCRILFGDLGMFARGSQRFNFRRRMAERWGRMTPEEREKFRQGMRSGCGDFAAPTSGARSSEARGPA